MATAVERISAGGEQRFSISGIDWKSYLAISEAFMDRHVRVTYNQGDLELMTISPQHARYGRLFGRFVTALTEELDQPIGSFGDMTCRREDALRGLEPDECFYLEHEPLVRGKNIDLEIDPPPDLAIEIELSPPDVDRMEVYSGLRIPEVWRFDGEQVSVWHSQDEGKYVPQERSHYFPFLRVADLTAFLLRTDLDDNALIRTFRAWLRDELDRQSASP